MRCSAISNAKAGTGNHVFPDGGRESRDNNAQPPTWTEAATGA